MTTLDDVFASVLTVAVQFPDGERLVRAVADEPMILTDGRRFPPRLRPVDLPGWVCVETIDGAWYAAPSFMESHTDE